MTRTSVRFQFQCYEAANMNPVTAAALCLACTDVAESLPVTEGIPLRTQTYSSLTLSNDLVS